jgi:hypothetical protein
MVVQIRDVKGARLHIQSNAVWAMEARCHTGRISISSFTIPCQSGDDPVGCHMSDCMIPRVTDEEAAFGVDSNATRLVEACFVSGAIHKALLIHISCQEQHISPREKHDSTPGGSKQAFQLLSAVM